MMKTENALSNNLVQFSDFCATEKSISKFDDYKTNLQVQIEDSFRASNDFFLASNRVSMIERVVNKIIYSIKSSLIFQNIHIVMRI